MIVQCGVQNKGKSTIWRFIDHLLIIATNYNNMILLVVMSNISHFMFLRTCRWLKHKTLAIGVHVLVFWIEVKTRTTLDDVELLK